MCVPALKATVRLDLVHREDLRVLRGSRWKAISRTSPRWHFSAAPAHSCGANHEAETTRRQQQHFLLLEPPSNPQRLPPHKSSTKVRALVLGLPGEAPVVPGPAVPQASDLLEPGRSLRER